ncbi:NAD(P)/FAD-dependent oxidoreductase [Roseomonas sp. GC11]|uniref:flavin-containing monooxygenase n=1 Tax=Roseomonas sp. GC11 TaxID=2950546 RepID=UPI00210DBAD3|nr:NAD(P)/FAD-dependent oxidoreductase [Roseomonas sp. GC11]MCQ4159863.1 NAD(P)/FAD-dependent oxidoreductase [Roseomonas sp. GC11]
MNATAEADLEAWLATLAARLEAGDPAGVAALFEEGGLWRDMLALSWSIVTFEGHGEIAALLARNLAAAAPRGLRLWPGSARMEGGVLEGWFRFETAQGRGRGHVRLRGGRCWTLFTGLEALAGFEEPLGPRRAPGTHHGAFPGRRGWGEQRAAGRAALGRETQPFCLIIGGGQAGVTLGARLKMLSVPFLIIDAQERPGDAWRQRYESLCLHDPVWANHLPYLPFPQHWPVFTPKDMMGDWIEAYARIMDLDMWCGTRALSAGRDEAAGAWRVTVERREGGRTERLQLHPRHLVIATGMSGAPALPAYPGRERFRGEQCHSSEYRSGAAYAGKRCVVIGSNNSAHDICADLWEHGAEVTMLQRSSTLVVRAETVMRFISGKLFSQAAEESGLTTEEADFILAARPFALHAALQKSIYAEIRRHDAAFYAGLERAGFLLDFGEDETGHSLKYLRRGSGYYIDVGASELVIRGDIRLCSGAAVRAVTEEGLALEDGRHLPADLIVYATGYDPMEGWIARLISPEVAARVGPVWGLGSGTRRDPGPWAGELRNMWKPTRQEGLWLHGGNLQQARFYSRILALQLKARLAGLATPVHDPRLGGV